MQLCSGEDPTPFEGAQGICFLVREGWRGAGAPPWPFVSIFLGKLCLALSWDYGHTPVLWAKFKVAGMGGVRTGEAGAGWANGNVSVPSGLESCSGSSFGLLLPQARELTEEEKE